MVRTVLPVLAQSRGQVVAEVQQTQAARLVRVAGAAFRVAGAGAAVLDWLPSRHLLAAPALVAKSG